MNRQDLVIHVSNETGINKSKSKEVLKSIFGGITQTLQSKDSVDLIGFGSFSVADTNARQGRNPRTGETIQIPAGRKVKFTSGKSLKQSVNS